MSETGGVWAVILAAGQSRRMGQPKLALPWGDRTVIGQVVATLKKAGIEEIVVVTGGASEQVQAALGQEKVTYAYNQLYENGEMLDSLRVGMRMLPGGAGAFLLALGDQPQMMAETVRMLVEKYEDTGASLIVPSFQMRRGHPWLIARSLWAELLEMQPPATMRNFIHQHAEEIQYVPVDTPTTLMDLDTPKDYSRSRPR